ncbi:MAG: Caffeine dehydrogenase subunit gamma [Alphaproteobacteria bacterium MarineAlpha11_Bin1]|nr:MAG: Caffeine dehydrogenase subunit gamma [Alphaproteobacteria bacterium MarineAlpha11_Bin1]|tara:strand:- start:11578 stop:12045 length:468 start_codon:yes stop_codon:yes gene_type:complete
MTEISIKINGEEIATDVESRLSLADFIRDHRRLTGTHLGCEHGVCGACTVLMDGEPVRSCITLAGVSNGSEITTIEGFDDDEPMSQLRQAFHENHALQCGYCTPGMLVAARDIVTRLPDAEEDRVRLELAGNLCRCTGYVGIVKAILSVLEKRRT